MYYITLYRRRYYDGIRVIACLNIFFPPFPVQTRLLARIIVLLLAALYNAWFTCLIYVLWAAIDIHVCYKGICSVDEKGFIQTAISCLHPSA